MESQEARNCPVPWDRKRLQLRISALLKTSVRIPSHLQYFPLYNTFTFSTQRGQAPLGRYHEPCTSSPMPALQLLPNYLARLSRPTKIPLFPFSIGTQKAQTRQRQSRQ